MQKHSFTFQATGTSWHITLWSTDTVPTVEKKIQNFVEDFEQTYSRFRTDSFLSLLTKKTGTQEVPENFTHMLRLYERLCRATEGAVTPLMGDVLSSAGYDRDYSFEKKKTPSVPDFLQAVHIVDDTHIDVHEPVAFDFGALGKGHLADLVAKELRSNKAIDRFLINAGGDLYYYAHDYTPLSVGLEHPENNTQAIGKIDLVNQALCASGANKRRWSDTAHHIIDPLTGESVERVLASWVLADTAAVADGLATSLFFVSPEALEKDFDFEWVVVERLDAMRCSQYFDGKLFSEHTS